MPADYSAAVGGVCIHPTPIRDQLRHRRPSTRICVRYVVVHTLSPATHAASRVGEGGIDGAGAA
jgi:hypothetical protein